LGQRIPGNDDPARFQKTLKLDYSLFKKATMQGCMGDQGLREIEIVQPLAMLGYDGAELSVAAANV
jgi:hypothetical protein